MAIQIRFYGAAGDVTGSAYHVSSGEAEVLVDFGMFQGVKRKEELNRMPRGMRARELDAVLVTHAHLDHTGRLPLLAQQGYEGPVYCTPATIEMSGLILRDSARVQAQDLERVNRKRQRRGDPPMVAMYGSSEVEAVLSLCREVPYGVPVPVAPGMEARYVEAGHMLGSASIELRVQEGGVGRTVVFSGDIGPRGAPILKDSVGFHEAEVVVMESTYGDRDHKPLAATVAEFETIVRETVERGGRILVPTFAVGRAQLLLYLLALMFRGGAVPKFPVYVDSPMALEATRIYAQHLELFDDEYQALQRQRPILADMDTMKPVVSAAESQALNQVTGPCLILAGAGMCNAGRILHHLRQNLWKPETSVVIVGFQSEGSLGRMLVDGAKRVSIFGEKVVVKAQVHTLGGFSAHAGRTDLLRWFEPLGSSRPRVILTHGETKAREALALGLNERFGLTAQLPSLGDEYEV